MLAHSAPILHHRAATCPHSLSITVFAEFEILRYREHCYYTYLVVKLWNSWTLKFIDSKGPNFHYGIQIIETFIFQSRVYLIFEIQILKINDCDPYILRFQTIKVWDL